MSVQEPSSSGDLDPYPVPTLIDRGPVRHPVTYR